MTKQKKYLIINKKRMDLLLNPLRGSFLLPRVRFRNFQMYGNRKVEYGFGAVLMEIIVGRPAYQNGEDGALTQWVSSMFGNGEIGRIVDPKLEGDFDVNSVKEALNIAFACLSYNSNDRPTMGEVLLKLKLCLQMETARLAIGYGR